MDKQTQLLRWRLILGKEIQKDLESIEPFTLSSEDLRLDTALASIYGTQDESLGNQYPSFGDTTDTPNHTSNESSPDNTSSDLTNAAECETADLIEVTPENKTDAQEEAGLQTKYESDLAEELCECPANMTLEHLPNGMENDPNISHKQIRQRIIQKYAVHQVSSEPAPKKQGTKEPPCPVIAKWIGDLYHFFDKDTVTIIQTDAIERKGLKKLIIEPNLIEKLEPNIKMLSTLLTLKDQIPHESKNAVRHYIKKVVEQIDKLLSLKLHQSIKTSLNRRRHSVIPSANAIDFPYTIKKNLKNYSKSYNAIIPEHIYFFDHSVNKKKFHIILDIDQSGSMYESVIYASVISCILASVKSIKTDVVLFSTEIVDITKLTNDPVELLYGLQIGGGTDIAKSLAYCQNLITSPEETIVFLISDLYEGGNQEMLIQKANDIKESGATLISILAISDEGTPDYNEKIAQRFAQLQIPCFACMPDKFPELLKNAIHHLPLDL